MSNDVLTSTTTEKIIDSLESIFSRHGLPVTCKSDNGPPFRSDLFREYCENNGIKHVRTTPKWAQANGEVERQNSSLMKRIKIAQAEGLDWKCELKKYVTVYRSIAHATTGKSPAELLFNRKIRGKLPDICESHTAALEVRDKDAEEKGKAKLYADERRKAQYSKVDIGDTVLIQQDRVDKFSTPFHPTPHKIVSKTGNQVVVESPTGAHYKRNTTHVKRFKTTEHKEMHSTQEETSREENSVLGVDTETNIIQTPHQDTHISDMTRIRPLRVKRAPERYGDFVLK